MRQRTTSNRSDGPRVPLAFRTLDEVAHLLRVSRASVNFWVYAARLRSVKAGRHRLVTDEALIEFLGLDG